MADTGIDFLSLAQIAGDVGDTIRCAGNLPLDLNQPDSYWFIEKGGVNLFLIEEKDGAEQAAPQYVLSRQKGDLIPNVPAHGLDGETTLKLIAKGSQGTQLKRLSSTSLDQINPKELAQQIDTWLDSFTETLARFVGHPPTPTAIATPGTIQAPSSSTLGVRRDVAWISLASEGSGLYMDMVEPEVLQASAPTTNTILPLTWTSWFTPFSDLSLTCQSTQELAESGELIPALMAFHRTALSLERLNRRLAVIDEANLDLARTASRRTIESNARRRLYNIHDLPIDQSVDDTNQALINALEIIGQAQDISFNFPKPNLMQEEAIGLEDIVSASAVRARKVLLNEVEKWWQSDSNPMLSYRKEDNRLVVLLPAKIGRYYQIDPISKTQVRVNEQLASELTNEAWVFYSPFPSGHIDAREIFKFGLGGTSGEVLRMLLAAIPATFINLLPALALGLIASSVFIGSGSEILVALAITLAAFGVLGVIFHLLQSTAMMRLESRATTRIEAAFWDRLMRLPSEVLNSYSTGDLAMATMTFQRLRDGVLSVAANGLQVTLISVPVLVVVFSLDGHLGVMTLLVGLVALVLAFYLGYRQVLPNSNLTRSERRVTSRLFQILTGIGKLRVENAEGSAYDIWAKEYRSQKQDELELSKYQSHSHALAASLPLIGGGCLIFTVVVFDEASIPMSDFLVVYILFTLLLSSVARVSESIGAIASVLPSFQEMQPLLSAELEHDSEGELVDYLGGDVLFDQISFRYPGEEQMVLNDVTIRARPGEFVAIAGESGAGKSTLFRLALGLSRPNSGAVYYDGRDLRHLNLKQVRQQIGAVPQSVGLHPQDLWDNLVSHREDAESEEVWRAARLAEIEDEIKSMPMGMMTMVGTGGSVLSGGESQRVTIARSVVGSPRIMLLDEATNWLDNENQSDVMQNLTTLTSTRIVIAHRLSTLEQADRIYVLKSGRVVQEGTFDDLLEVEGEFKELVKRQII